MGGFGGFYKGEKKKAKKNKNNVTNASFGSAPVFTLPKLMEKKKKAE